MERDQEQPFPDFLIFVDNKLGQIKQMEVPIQFINDFGHKIPSQVTLELPNGSEYFVTLKHEENTLHNVTSIFRDNNISLPATIHFWDYDAGKFKIFIMNQNGTEMKYPSTAKSLSSSYYRQDETGGAGWRFLVKTTSSTIQTGEIVIPTEFYRRFHNILPHNITYSLTNGERFEGYYSRNNRKLTGLMILAEVNYINASDYLLFTYCTEGIFEIGVFGQSKIEKIFHDYRIDQRQNIENEENVINGETFSVVMLWSHVDQNSHGVLIPEFIKPNNRDWTIGETVIFRRAIYAWNIGIVYSNHKPRFSKGWNKFVRDNGIQINQTVTFTMQQEEDNIIFDVRFCNIPHRLE